MISISAVSILWFRFLSDVESVSVSVCSSSGLSVKILSSVDYNSVSYESLCESVCVCELYAGM